MAELLRRHWYTAVLLAGRVFGSPDLTRDAVQEAAIAAMTDLARLRSPDRFGAWFCGIALNVSRRWLRQLQSEVPGLRPDLASVSPDPAEAAEIADTAARVRGAIAALADGQQHAVRLFYLQGLSHRQVAGELGISVGAVKARLHQARAALAPKLVQFMATPEAGLGRSGWDAMQRHPWAARLAYSRPSLGPNALSLYDTALGELDALGFDASTRMGFINTILGHVLGSGLALLEERTMRARAGLPTDADLDKAAAPYLERIAAAGRHPHFTRWASDPRRHTPQPQSFEQILEWLLDGLQPLADNSETGKGPSRV